MGFKRNRWAEIRSKGEINFLWKNVGLRVSAVMVETVVILVVALFHWRAGILSAEFLEFLAVGLLSGMVGVLISGHAHWLFNEWRFKDNSDAKSAAR